MRPGNNDFLPPENAVQEFRIFSYKTRYKKSATEIFVEGWGAEGGGLPIFLELAGGLFGGDLVLDVGSGGGFVAGEIQVGIEGIEDDHRELRAEAV